ncbi:MazG-like family protein [Clostridium swellfunianum]|uniref:MazG-like family protein n=1 Tax=Clostridium swellfunianum TaxID=1367462 RepID=UPI00202F13C0|nr:MazG-like family protein [Clostridium swellfunianum]
MRNDEFNIMSSVKVIEQYKARLLTIIGDFFTLLTKGSNVAQDAILDCISKAIIILYLLADRLGYSHTAVDESMKKNLREGLSEEDKYDNDLRRLYTHLKERQ